MSERSEIAARMFASLITCRIRGMGWVHDLSDPTCQGGLVFDRQLAVEKAVSLADELLLELAITKESPPVAEPEMEGDDE